MAKNKLVWTQTHQVPGSAEMGVRRLTTADLGVAFQPIVDVTTGQLFAQEALARPKVAEYPNPPALFESRALSETQLSALLPSPSYDEFLCRRR